MSPSESKLTPMMQQYFEVKDEILFAGVFGLFASVHHL